MPQMMPMNWLMIFFSIFLMFNILISLFYFMMLNFYMKKLNKMKIKFMFWNWMW